MNQGVVYQGAYAASSSSFRLLLWLGLPTSRSFITVSHDLPLEVIHGFPKC
nr:MAG TPA: hypothetical protein [Caudoviricetes sp.]